MYAVKHVNTQTRKHINPDVLLSIQSLELDGCELDSLTYVATNF
jgi:hypothetical protein